LFSDTAGTFCFGVLKPRGGSRVLYLLSILAFSLSSLSLLFLLLPLALTLSLPSLSLPFPASLKGGPGYNPGKIFENVDAWR
jgi:hypothetical protein